MNQKTLNIIYGIVIVVLIGVVVYFVMGKKSEPVAQQPSPTPTQEIDTSKPNPTPTPTPIPTNQNKNYLAIKEWGVRFEKPAGLNDLQYVMFDNTGNVVSFTTQQLVNLDKSTGGKYCTADHDPIGTLFRVQNFDIYTQNGRDIPTNVHIGNYYYYFTGPQATCSDNKQVQALESGQISSLQSIILKSLKATP